MAHSGNSGPISAARHAEDVLVAAAKAYAEIADKGVSVTIHLNPPQDGSWGWSFDSRSRRLEREANRRKVAERGREVAKSLGFK